MTVVANLKVKAARRKDFQVLDIMLLPKEYNPPSTTSSCLWNRTAKVLNSCDADVPSRDLESSFIARGLERQSKDLDS